MTRLPIAALLYAASACAAGAQVPLVSPQFGEPPNPSAITVRLLAVARPTAAFLERTSRLALDQSTAARLRAFARREAAEQAAAEEVLTLSAAPTPVTRDPLDLAAVGAASVDEGAETILSKLPRLLRTPGARAVAADRTIALASGDELARLTGLEGRAFDKLYVLAQIEGLERLATLYRDYVQNGDDEALRALSVHELRGVRARLAELKRS